MIATIRSISSYVCWNRRSDPDGIGHCPRPWACERLAFACATRLEIVAPGGQGRRRARRHRPAPRAGTRAPARCRRPDRGARRGGLEADRQLRPARPPACSVRARCSERSIRTPMPPARRPTAQVRPLFEHAERLDDDGNVRPSRRSSAAANGLRARFAVQMNATRAVIERQRCPSSAGTVSERYRCASRSETRGRRTVPE